VIDRNAVGRTWGPWEVEIERGRLRLLAKAIGETRGIYTDAAAARAAGYRDVLAPPTIAFCLLSDDPDGKRYLDEVGVPVARMLHAEQRLTFHEPLCAGDRVTVSRRVADVFSKKGGALEFIAFESEVRLAADGRLLATGRQLVAVRVG
jgi:acyl dehydratase